MKNWYLFRKQRAVRRGFVLSAEQFGAKNRILEKSVFFRKMWLTSERIYDILLYIFKGDDEERSRKPNTAESRRMVRVRHVAGTAYGRFRAEEKTAAFGVP